MGTVMLALAGCGGQAPTPPTANEGPPSVRLTADRLSGEATFASTFRAVASDPDGDPLSFAWSLDGVLDPSVSGPEVTVTFREAGTYVVDVIVSDGTFSASDSATVEVRDDYRPAEAPAVLVVGFAGRCGAGVFFDCVAPRENRDYLGDEPLPGTMDALVGAFTQLGYATAGVDFRSHLDDSTTFGFGYRAADDLLSYVRDEWIRDFLDPTRIVLVGHSHGAQFMSLLAFDRHDVSVEYAVYFDAVCDAWDFDHIASGLFAMSYGAQADFPYPLDATGRACDAIAVTGLARPQHLADVVPPNVVRALEVQSYGVFPPPDPGGLISDVRVNHRLDGSTGPHVGIATAYFPNEVHNDVHRVDSEAMAWVTDMIARNGFSDAGAEGATALQVLPTHPPARSRSGTAP